VVENPPTSNKYTNQFVDNERIEERKKKSRQICVYTLTIQQRAPSTDYLTTIPSTRPNT